MPELVNLRWRVGRHVGRTIYAMLDRRIASDDDILIGLMDSEELAREAVTAHNTRVLSST